MAALDAKSNTPAVRAAQASILTIPHTGMAVTIDIGDRKNVHPKDKQDVGDRLCRIALANAYGQAIEFSGPVVESVRPEKGVLRLTFTHAAGGLVAKGSSDGALNTFEVAGSDGNYVPAMAKIEGDSVVVSSPDVSSPTMVRYAWANYPEGCNLYNAPGLPATPFEAHPQQVRISLCLFRLYPGPFSIGKRHGTET